MVRRLVKEEDMRGALGNVSEHQARLLPVRHVPDRSRLHLAGDTEAADPAAPGLDLELLLREARVHVLQRGLVQVELVRRVLVVLGDAQMRVLLHLALGRRQLPEHELQQRRLPSSVRSDQRDARVQVDRKLQSTVQHALFLAVVGEGDVVDGHHGGRDLAAVWELELDELLHLGLLRQARLHHLVDDLLLRLRLLHQVGVCSARGDELLQVLDVGLLFLVALHLVDLDVALGLDEGVVVARIVLELALVREVDDVGAHAVHEILRMRHEHHDRRVLGQVLLQPHTRLHVQMVGRLVEQQQCRLHQQRPPKSHTHPPSSGQIARFLREERTAESQTHEDLGRAHLESRGVKSVDSVVDVSQNFSVGASCLHQGL
mmetsp:Transcript_51583/g.121021  ORF Transcript_51583/g.121021 Transcript_51583/m.121021 type:complete len:374 (+) Transcript_51583:1264-2385(+)